MRTEQEIYEDYKKIKQELLYTNSYDWLLPEYYYKCKTCGYYFMKEERYDDKCPNDCINKDYEMGCFDEEETSLKQCDSIYDIICDYNELLDKYNELKKKLEGK